MRVTVAPASTKTGAPVIRILLATPQSGVKVKALYRNLSKVPSEFTSDPRFEAVCCDVDDQATIDFEGSEVVMAITPPVYDGGDIVAISKRCSENVKIAIEKSSFVQKIVLLSSVCGQYNEDVGEIKTNHMAETVSKATKVPEIIIVRCAYFMENWTASLDTLRGPEPFFFSTVVPLEWVFAMVAIADVGASITREVLKQTRSPRCPHVFELYSPQWYTPLDVQAALSAALNKEVAVKPVERGILVAFTPASSRPK
ncbi:NAD-dependent epimerase/dehydratase [Moelleriella libera RCEF 2490]|uniref:NAD-dependent epimerase/dehydratase n=1 Tax=Moelleriella libera RCEF 2490 TaxID=1081109 RepID=A0A162IBA6_9HYPO|nr:NAD-dependent epimerase/dehydratase [Moelleriella libera RCEF 2490]